MSQTAQRVYLWFARALSGEVAAGFHHRIGQSSSTAQSFLLKNALFARPSSSSLPSLFVGPRRAFSAAAVEELSTRRESGAASSAPFSPEDLSGNSELASKVAMTKGWWEGYATCKDLGETLISLSENSRAPINRNAVYRLLELVQSTEDLDLALKALRACRRGMVEANCGWKTLRTERHGALLLQLVERYGSAQHMVTIVERLERLGFEASTSGPIVAAVARALSEKGEVMMLFRCMVALEKAHLLDPGALGKDTDTASVFREAFLRAGREDLARVVKDEFEAREDAAKRAPPKPVPMGASA